mgnify:CR=1 FL=1
MCLLLTFAATSCQNLEEDISSHIFIDNLKSEEDVIAAITPIYRQLHYVFAYPQRHLFTALGADDLTTWWAGGKSTMRTFDRFGYGQGRHADLHPLKRNWDSYWKIVYRANTVIEGLKTATAPSETVAWGDGEARFLRALAYFYLVKIYGNMPVVLDGYIYTGREQRATVRENYLHIEQDLKVAEATLPGPASVREKGWASSVVAKALLADLYLTWAGWPVKDASKYVLAAAKAKEVIDMNYFELLPIDELWLLENQNSKEAIFSIQFSKTEDLRSGYPAAFSFHESRGWSDAYPELQFFRDFPDGARKAATFTTEIPQRTVVDRQIVWKDPPTKPWQDSNRNHPMYKKFTLSEDLTISSRTSGYRAIELFRYAEVLLIYAEAQAVLGQNSSSLEALNQVKRRAAGIPYLTPSPSVDVVSATPYEIIDEKGWELAGEFKRWFDLIRSERLEEVAAQRDPLEQVTLEHQPSKDQYIIPIPAEVVQTSLLLQNPEGFVSQ